jgi:hypothetical protein
MNQNTNNNPEPKAWIATYGSRKKIKNDKNVYLKDLELFEIELFNPTTNKYLAKISINGKFISNSGLVLNPGQRVFLKRFIDENKAFVFNTYDVDSMDEESKKAIVDNGKVKVYFYAEYVSLLNTGQNSGITYWGVTNTPYYYGTFTTNLANTAIGTTTNTADCSFTNTSSSSSIETGRVEKGDITNQSFGSDYGNYNSFHSHVSSYQLLPESRMPIEVSDLKIYCTECGKKAGHKDNFCGKCGNDLRK